MEVTCTHCGTAFSVPSAMKGGIANCPDCRRAVEVPGRTEGMYWAWLGLGTAGVLAAGAAGFALGGPAVGGTVLFLGLVAAVTISLIAQ